MSVKVTSERLSQYCPGCGRLLRIPPEMKGQKVACKFCDHPVTVGAEEQIDTERGLSHCGTGTAFQIERTWTASEEKEGRFTIIKHPSKQALRGYTMAVECAGPARINMAGLTAKDGKAMNLGKVRPKEIRVVPLDELNHAYLWLDKGATTTVKVIVGRLS